MQMLMICKSGVMYYQHGQCWKVRIDRAEPLVKRVQNQVNFPELFISVHCSCSDNFSRSQKEISTFRLISSNRTTAPQINTERETAIQAFLNLKVTFIHPNDVKSSV